MGVSFGGLPTQEIGPLRPLARVVLISSLGSPHDLLSLLRLARPTSLHRLVPFGLLARLLRLAQWFFEARRLGFPLTELDSAHYQPHLRPLGHGATSGLAQAEPARCYPPARHPRPVVSHAVS